MFTRFEINRKGPYGKGVESFLMHFYQAIFLES